MNPYLKNLKKIEFVITDACTGKCKHCSQGDHLFSGEHIDPDLASDAVWKIAREYPIQTVMTFGGEPLLFSDTVCAIMKTATKLGISKRQVITNGFFSKDENLIQKVCASLAESGVNDLLLSVDAFHQETIPLENVRVFAEKAKEADLPLRLQPAWLSSSSHNNPYNEKTRRILDCFSDLGIVENEGNVVFPEGNAKKFLSEYFTDEISKNPYEEDPYAVRCVSFSSSGDVLGGNIYHQDIMDILCHYQP